MKFKNFSIHASPFISDAYCECGNSLKEVSNGFFSIVMFCSICENIYQLKLIKVPNKKIDHEFLEQCIKNSVWLYNSMLYFLSIIGVFAA